MLKALLVVVLVLWLLLGLCAIAACIVVVLVLWLLLGLCAIAACIVSGRFRDPDSLRHTAPGPDAGHRRNGRTSDRAA